MYFFHVKVCTYLCCVCVRGKGTKRGKEMFQRKKGTHKREQWNRCARKSKAGTLCGEQMDKKKKEKVFGKASREVSSTDVQ